MATATTLTNLLDSALSTFWGITESGLWAIQEIYSQAAARGGPINLEAIQAIMKENEEIGSFLHLTDSFSGKMKSQKLIPMDATRHIHVVEGTGIAIANLFGPIYPRANMMTSSGATSIEQYVGDFAKAHSNGEIKGIIQRGDSPGGDVRKVGESAKTIHGLVKTGEKPVKTYVEGLGASAALYILSTSEEMTGNESSLTGSVGVVLSGQRKGEGEYEVVSSVSPDKRPDVNDPQGKAVMQQQVDDLADIFVKDISKYYGVSKDKVTTDFGRGAVMAGPRAKAAGMLNRVTTLSQLVEEMRRDTTTSRMAVGKAAGWSDKVIASFYGELEDDILEAQADASVSISEEIVNMSWKSMMEKFKTSKEEIAGATPTQTTTVAPESPDSGTPTVEGAAAAQPPVVVKREDLMDGFADAGALFATEMLADKRIMPFQQGSLALELINAKVDDKLIGGTVPFANEKGELIEGTREAAVRARYAALPQHTVTQQAIAAVAAGQAQAHVLKEGDDEKVSAEEVKPERLTALLASSAQGQLALANRKENGNK